MGERVSSDDLAALLFRERCFILDGLMTFSCERVADAVILRWIDIFIVSSSSRCGTNLPSVFFQSFFQTSPRGPSQRRVFSK